MVICLSYPVTIFSPVSTYVLICAVLSSRTHFCFHVSDQYNTLIVGLIERDSSKVGRGESKLVIELRDSAFPVGSFLFYRHARQSLHCPTWSAVWYLRDVL